MKLPHINFKLIAIGLAVCVLSGALLGWLSGMPFWGGALIVAAGLVINGVVAEVEDRAPVHSTLMSRWLAAFFLLLVRPFLALILGVNLRHTERLPQTAPAILAIAYP